MKRSILNYQASDNRECLDAEDGLGRARQLLSTTLLSWNSLVNEWRDVKKRAAMDVLNAAKEVQIHLIEALKIYL